MSETETETELDPQPLGPRLNRALRPLVLIGAVALFGIRFFSLIFNSSVNVLFSDQWVFMEPLFTGDASFGQLFLRQHGPIREGVGLIADKFLYSWTSWNTRADCFMIGGSVFAAMLLAMILKRRLFGKFSYGDVAMPMMFLTLAQFETLTGTPNAAYSAFPLVFMMFYCLAMLHRRYWVRYAVCLLLNFLLIFTGFGFFMGIVTIALLALECYWSWRGLNQVPMRASFPALAIAGVSLGLFFVNYKFQPAVDCFVFPYHDLRAYPRYVALMISGFVGLKTPLTAATVVGVSGLVAAAGVLCVATWRVVKGRSVHRAESIVVVLLAYTALFTANTAVGRVCLGLSSAWSSRYVTLLIPGVLAIYFYLQSLRSMKVRTVLVAGLTLLLIPGCLRLSTVSAWLTAGKRVWVGCYLRTEDIDRCDRLANFQIYPSQEPIHLKEKLDYLKAHNLNLFDEEY